MASYGWGRGYGALVQPPTRGSGGVLGCGLREGEDDQTGGNPQGLGGRDRVRRFGQPDGGADGGQAAPRRLSYLGGDSLCTSTSSPVKWTVYFQPGLAGLPGLMEAASPQLQTAGNDLSWASGCPAWAGSRLTLPSRASLCDPETPPLAVPAVLPGGGCLMGDVPGVWGVHEERQREVSSQSGGAGGLRT